MKKTLVGFFGEIISSSILSGCLSSPEGRCKSRSEKVVILNQVQKRIEVENTAIETFLRHHQHPVKKQRSRQAHSEDFVLRPRRHHQAAPGASKERASSQRKVRHV
jgi:hypothetical protein